jgi:hypothetical protein
MKLQMFNTNITNICNISIIFYKKEYIMLRKRIVYSKNDIFFLISYILHILHLFYVNNNIILHIFHCLGASAFSGFAFIVM